MTCRYRKKILINSAVQAAVFVILLFIDQITKYMASVHLAGGADFVLIDGILELRYLENSGAAFGIFQNRMWLFYILTAVVMIIIALIWILSVKKLLKYINYAGEEPSKFKSATYTNIVFFDYLLVILASGAIGNLIDRIRYEYVIDFIYFRMIDFPIFNFADICVTLSAVLLVIFFIFIYKDDENFKLFDNIWQK